MKTTYKYKNLMRKIAHVFESFLTIIILVGIFLGSIDVLKELCETFVFNKDGFLSYENMNSFLGQVILLVIGLELVIMLTLHSTKALLEVLVFAIAHKLLLLPKNQGMDQLLLGIIAIACLFAIKKYLLTPDALKPDVSMNDDEEHYIV